MAKAASGSGIRASARCAAVGSATVQSVGHAHLIGCSFDELGRTEDALPYFERAAQAHPEEPMYLANIAECHEKLGRMDLALQWARTALDRGATSELCQRIVREAQEA